MTKQNHNGARTSLAGALARHTTLRQLQVFEAVARLGSFTRAAEELYLAQPTVSMQLKKLADTVGMPLFDQTGIRIRLTDTGREVYAACQEVFRAMADLEMKVADLKGVKRGRLRLGVITSAKYLAPHLIGQFSRQHPGIDFSLKVTNREYLLERIANHEDDLYILGQPPSGLDVEAHPLVPNPLVVMASRDHPLAGAPNIPLKRLLEEPFVLRESGSGTRDAVFRLLEEHGLQAPMVRMELSSNESIKQAIVAGLGITVLSLHSLVLEGTSGPIALLDVQGFPIQRHWYLAHWKGHKTSLVARAFLDFVKQEGRHIAENLDREIAKVRRQRSSGPGTRSRR
ncbi:MAG: LysR substrate-binding domain-containing protein [Gammaproteobacteria bacterium]|nr:LysR substrate-binding domain-containing protein [Gammaproteobacteria bacterium]